MYRFKSHSWTAEEIEEWKPLWYRLWELGSKWEWQFGDLYAYPNGTVAFAYVSGSPVGRVAIVPLPSFDTICNMGSAVSDVDEDLYLDISEFLDNIQPHQNLQCCDELGY